jgi:hypothetical protein
LIFDAGQGPGGLLFRTLQRKIIRNETRNIPTDADPTGSEIQRGASGTDHDDLYIQSGMDVLYPGMDMPHPIGDQGSNGYQFIRKFEY